MLVLFFILGLSIGSFLNVLADRIPKNKSIGGRSSCDNCKRTLSWRDLIPLLSFLLLRGRCRYCKARISVQYPLVELSTGILFSLVFLTKSQLILSGDFVQVFNLFFYLYLISSLIVIFLIDLRHKLIPDIIIVPLSLVGLLWLVLINPSQTAQNVAAGLGVVAFFLLIFIVTKGKGLGLGDVKFSFLMGLILGVSGTIVALYLAFLTGGAIGLILILWKKKNLKTALPFGPFLVSGFLISLFFSSPIIVFFLSLI